MMVFGKEQQMMIEKRVSNTASDGMTQTATTNIEI